MAVKIQSIDPGSHAEILGIQPGETLLSINEHEIYDVLDYRFYETNSHLTLSVEDTQGAVRTLHLRKGQYESIGLEFATYLMDQQHSCRNKCVFCFIDQLPPGMRESLYFKDDDARLSFLFGNYITLTNLSERDINRIIEMHISPVNVSVHTTDPELRCKMMGNRFAGKSLAALWRFAEHGIRLNCQIVLCPGLNDGEALSRTLHDLVGLGASLESIACVPVGVTRYREGLYPLQTFDRESARNALDIMEQFGEACIRTRGARTVYASDEFYLLAERPIPDPEYYEDFPQIENGVGMFASMQEEFSFALEDLEGLQPFSKPRFVTVITGEAAADFIRGLLDEAVKRCDNLTYQLLVVQNDFFGGTVNVSGLLTGGDMIRAAKGKTLGDELLIPGSTLRSEGDLFLDGVSLAQMQETLGVPVTPVQNDGGKLLSALIGKELSTSWQNQ